MGRLSDFRILVAPGLYGSDERHWQTRWEALHPAFERIEQWRWDCPDLFAWSAQVGHALRRSARPAIVVAHSFGCLATVHRAAAGAPQLAGALLVAPADPAKFGIVRELKVGQLPVPSLVVGSENDPWLTAERARLWASEWDSDFVNAGALGHINAESGLNDWPAGIELLDALAARIQHVPACRCGRDDRSMRA
ncbi:alpha/beta hydrolase [Massilia terrae]|uniref:Alpha/beta hydrolase n=1 Tax=Massilia terrae TaxID=1811224 RepID=A0ABT2CXF6_9BURK|nr:alpha/beta hydrolase [Massilia terrae]MCS0657788.1 alpha/beta hydrolase [Massilia terrae]